MSEAATTPVEELLRSPLARRPHTASEIFVLFWRAGWRPFVGWVCGLVLLTNGVVLQGARLWGFAADPLPWRDLTPFVAVLVGLTAARSVEKIFGAAE